MPMGIAVIGGLTVGTFFTLYVVPAIYSYLSRREVGEGLLEELAEETGEGARAA